MTDVNEIIKNYFVGKYLLPTDNIRQQSDAIVKNYIRKMKANEAVYMLHVATKDKSRIGQVRLVKDLVKSNTPIYLIDGHHRFIAWLSNSDYPLQAKFIDYEPYERSVSELYDYLDRYEYFENFANI